ncbi:MAG: hypothetical protein IPN54_02390 [Bacteroidetes bacterium]|nr:hypothetical protein [Bacteroidota bacterium]
MDEYWNDPCLSTFPTIVFNTQNDTVAGLSFGYQSTFTCPSPWIDISSGVLRVNTPANYFVNYGNYGLPASNLQVKIELDPCFTPNSSLPMWDSYQNNTLVYNIGSLSILESGMINISGIICPGAGQTVCAKAIISPTFICNPPDSAYDRYQLLVYGNCINSDTVRFVLKNEHPTILTHVGIYEIYEDNAIVLVQPFSIAQGDSIVIFHPANNHSVRIQVKFLTADSTRLL